MSPPPVSISCTIMVMPSPSGGNLKSHIFLNLMGWCPTLKPMWDQFNLDGSLLTLLHQKVLAEGGDSGLYQSGYWLIHHPYLVMSRRYHPCFLNLMELQTPVFLYQSFGLLSSLDLEGPPSSPTCHYYSQSRTLLTQLADTSASQTFYDHGV